MTRADRLARQPRLIRAPWTHLLIGISAAVGAVRAPIGLAMLLVALLFLRPPVVHLIAYTIVIMIAALVAIGVKGPNASYASNLSILILLLLADAAYVALQDLRESPGSE